MVESFINVGMGIFMILQPGDNAIGNTTSLIAAATMGFIHIWLGLYLRVNYNRLELEMFTVSIILRAIYTGALLADFLINFESPRFIAIVVYSGTLLYAASGKLQEIELTRKGD